MLIKTNREVEIKNGQSIQIYKRLGADKTFIKSREAALQKYWAKISNPCDKARARKKPPVEIDSIYRNRACLAFQYNDGYWGCLIVAESKYFKRKIEGYFLQTDMHSTVIGYLPVWENSYTGSFGGRNPYSLPTYEEFKQYNADYLKKILDCRERTSETIEQINADFESDKSAKLELTERPIKICILLADKLH